MNKFPEVVYDVFANGWRPKINGEYSTTVVLKKQGALAHLVSRNYSQLEAKLYLEAFAEQLVIYGADMVPGGEAVATSSEGLPVINLWVPPTLVPKEAPFPTIRAALGHLTKGEPEAVTWLEHWFAAKVQDPNAVPKVAVIASTSQGAGKGFLARAIFEILGPRNCAIVKQHDFESHFNGMWVQKLFVLGDEAMSNENFKDISQLLKILIDGGELTLERKYENQRQVRSRQQFFFASNDRVTPLVLEDSDRRYTYLDNFGPVPPEYTAKLNACFETDRVTPTPAFLEEIAGFAYYLHGLKVDHERIRKPYMNAARAALIEASLPSQDAFMKEVDEHGFDAVLAEAKEHDLHLNLSPGDKAWDFGTEGVAFAALYKVYRSFCKTSGQFPLRMSKLGAALRNHTPQWARVRNTHDGRRMWCYVVPRSGR